MHIQHLKLTNYRNIARADIEFSPEVNVLLGQNAQGKTNVMEAAYVLGMAKSHRTPRDKELIKWDETYAKIEGDIVKKNSSLSMRLVISEQGKKARLNQLEQKKLSMYLGALNVVMFAPEDLHLVKGSPQVRRRFLDMEIGQVSPMYMHHLSTYVKVLKQRNQLLKNMQRKKQDPVMLDVLTEQLADTAATLTSKRFSFLALLQQWAAPIHAGITEQHEALRVAYKPSLDVSANEDLSTLVKKYLEKFQAIREKEIERGSTLIGPHRDDLLFYVNEKEVQTYGSQGQQRTTALSLKLAELELIRHEVGEYPVLLLDDVLSELDNSRQTHLLNTIQGKVQTFVTTTNVDGIEHDTIQKAAMFSVRHGDITKTR
ncbi:DNA replication/repair protein RecF [Aureibacillus halotolerans]|uniref:DNA replication and repair protein RecF n=1 Tax=Aureibacillus halotolerans TaxID=1508390 RepID=A0A4V3D518_9BACI|nr:DNA replication/repair protein RecF [Aureibacillus halotolerans]TDQ38337.1 DNA replication and repair protein RecF [Aureibacillus halotolerans]